MSHLLTLLILLCFAFGAARSAPAQDAASAPADGGDAVATVEAIDRVLRLLDDAEAREGLAESLRALRRSLDPGDALPAPLPPPRDPAAASAETPAEEPAPVADLVSAVAVELSRLRETPDGAADMPIETRIEGMLDTAAADLRRWWRDGVEGGGLAAFGAWAVPGWLAAAAAALAGAWLPRRLIRPHRTAPPAGGADGGTAPAVAARGRRRAILGGIASGLLSVMLAAAALAAWARWAGGAPAWPHLFLAAAAPFLAGGATWTVLRHGLLLLVPSRGARRVAYAQRRLAPWVAGLLGATVASAMLREAAVIAVLGGGVAALAALLLDLAIGATAAWAMLRYRQPVRILILGGHAEDGVPDAPAPIRSAVRFLGRRWHVLGVLFMAASLIGRMFGLASGYFIVTAILNLLLLFAGLSAAALLDGALARSVLAPRTGGGAVSTAPGLAARPVAVRIVASLRVLLQLVLGFLLFLLSLELWGFEVGRWLASEGGRAIARPILAILAMLSAGWLLWVVVDAAIARAVAPVDHRGRPRPRNPRVQTLLPLLRNFVFVALSVITVIVVLANLGLDVTPLLAGAGVIGLAIGFGSQQLVQDVITGMFMLFEDSIAVGDVIDTGDRAGVVEAMTIRTVRIRDGDGSLHAIPFSQIKALKNRSRDYGVFTVRLAIGYGADIDAVMAAMREVGTEMQHDPDFGPRMLAGLELWGVDQLAADGVIVMGGLRTRPLQQWAIGREYNRRIKKRLDVMGVPVALPRIAVEGPRGAGG